MLMIRSRSLDGSDAHMAGRQLLGQLYQEYTGREMPLIARTERGKPYFISGGLHFSISHSKAHVFCALSDCPVGIDAEEEDRKIDLRLAEKILSPGEKEQYLAAGDQHLALLTFWVLKEAAAKYTGEGLRGYPNKTNFSLDDPRVQRVDGCLLAVITEE